MNISRRVQPGALELAIEGRLDSYWADHLDGAIATIVQEGHHRLRLDLSRTTFISSAGIAVLMKYYKQLLRINGSLAVAQASEAVRLVLDMTRLTPVLVAVPLQAPAATVPLEGQVLEREGVRLEVFELTPGGALSCRTVGRGTLEATDAGETHRLACHPSLFAVGIGAIGGTDAECHGRFGDLLAAGGAVVYQPGDGTNMPDYLVGNGAAGGAPEASTPAPEARLLYGLVCEGAFAALARFESTCDVGAAPLSRVAARCLEIAGGRAAGIVMVAEASGLVGAVLRQLPGAAEAAGARTNGEPFFAYPQVRDRLLFTAERAFARSVVLIVGTVATAELMGRHPQYRPLGRDRGLVGHFHAAAFAFRPFRKGRLNLGETLATLFETERVMGVLHLLHDDRATGGVGETELIRGACWTAPIHAWT